jgi:hypothetical protein
MVTRDELIERLRKLATLSDPEEAHIEADGALIEYLNDLEIAEAYDAVGKWYA